MIMPEQQNIEYKSSWHDDYLKWVCGFANAQGGKIYIGMNDAATVVAWKTKKRCWKKSPTKLKTIWALPPK
jgi:ATP-dependent DNA helicase RecG